MSNHSEKNEHSERRNERTLAVTLMHKDTFQKISWPLTLVAPP